METRSVEPSLIKKNEEKVKRSMDWMSVLWDSVRLSLSLSLSPSRSSLFQDELVSIELISLDFGVRPASARTRRHPAEWQWRIVAIRTVDGSWKMRHLPFITDALSLSLSLSLSLALSLSLLRLLLHSRLRGKGESPWASTYSMSLSHPRASQSNIADNRE